MLLRRFALALPFLVACSIGAEAPETSQNAVDGGCVVPPPSLQGCDVSAVCDVQADCATVRGTYCGGPCATAGCVRHQCVLTKVQGAACAADVECVSQICAAGKCEPEP